MARTRRTTEIDRLCRGMQSLPQELYDIIWNDVFTAPAGFRYIVDTGARTGYYQLDRIKGLDVRRSLHLLHVCSTSREFYAQSYYGPDAIFEVHGCELFGDVKLLQTWLKSLSGSHRARLHLVNVVVDLRDDAPENCAFIPQDLRWEIHSEIQGDVVSKIKLRIM